MSDENAFKPEVTFTFIGEADDSFKPTVENIVKGTVANPLFPLSQTKAINVKNLFLVYAPTVVERELINSETAAARVAARTPLEAALRDFLPDIQAESGGSLVALLTTKIPLARNPVTQQVPFQPNTINLYIFGNPTQFYAQCEVQKNAHIYYAQVSADQVTWPWQSSDRKSAVAFSNLPVGTNLYLQMMVKNAVGASEWSSSKPFMIPGPGITIPQKKRPKGVK